MTLKARLLSALLALAILAPTPTMAGKLDFLSSVRPMQAYRFNPYIGGEELANMCTASSINQEQSLWLTAAHCVAGGDDRYIGGIKVEIVEQKDSIDLAVVKVPGLKVKAIKFAKKGPAVGDLIMVAGHPLGLKPLFLTIGYVANPSAWFDDGDRFYMLYGVTGAPGNSGSPVVNKKGELVSLLQIGWISGGGFSPMMGGSTWASLNGFLKYHLPK